MSRGWITLAVAASVLFTAGVPGALATTASGSPTAAAPSTTSKGAAAKATTAAPVTALCATPKTKNQARCFALRVDNVDGGKGVRPLADAPTGFGATDLQQAYKLPASGGAGETVAIVDAYDNPNAEADLAVYRTQYGLPSCTTANGCFSKVNQRGVAGSYPTPDAGWAGEIALDLDMVSAAAPNAHILLVEGDSANFDDLGASVNMAVAKGAKYVSNSYGSNYSSTPGSGEDASDLQLDDQYYKHPGVVVTASSGDGDFGVAYPAASPYVTSVGGTALVKDASTARGWTESVWHNSYGGPGSGCSTVEPKPSFQTASVCTTRSVADVSAVADPVTGVAIYLTYQNDGWQQYGGTSAASPLIAGVYASAGTPVANTYPNSYPYAAPGALNDVTVGANGTCHPTQQCTAGPGYDGPTGLGTPNGTAAFVSGPQATVSGTITDSVTKKPLAGATVRIGYSSATTAANGTYSVSVPAGTHDVSALDYGYTAQTRKAVVFANQAKVTESFALVAVPTVNVSGNVTDGSGHAWPLYAKITIPGVPGAPIYTNPATGHYSVDLPSGKAYSITATSNYPGYRTVTTKVTAGTTDVVANIAEPIDVNSCTAPGYVAGSTGTTQPFSGTTAPAGWKVTNATDGGGWQFTDDEPRGNLTGGTGGFAIVDSDHLGTGKSQDTVLTAPAQDFTSAQNPTVSFDTDFKSFLSSQASVELSTNAGKTWTTIWQTQASVVGPAHIKLPLTGAAGKSGVLVRFHYTGSFAYFWEVDNVLLGNLTCAPVSAGLVVGHVLDANTGLGVAGATVSASGTPVATATTTSGSADPNLGDGFYWLVSTKTGARSFTAAKSKYTSVTAPVTVAANYTTTANFTLKAGRLVVTPALIAKTVPWAGTLTSNLLTLKNTGTEPVNVTIGEQPGGFVPQAVAAAAHTTKAVTSKLWLGRTKSVAKAAAPLVSPTDSPWTPIADLPITDQDNAADVDSGVLYNGFGYDGSADTSNLYALDTATGAWTTKTPAADTREAPSHGFINGKWYISGGWGATGDPDAKTEVYDPSTDAWTTAAANPAPFAGAGSAVLGGKLYTVGGCESASCGVTDVSVFDPAANTWTALADYPEAVAWEACGALDGKIYCAGGTTDASSISHAYVYDPSANTWSPVTDMPADLWGSATTAANGKLLVSGGVVDNGGSITNTGYAYDPSTDSWTALPNSTTATYRGASACGFYKVGGNPGGSSVPPVATGEYLPGYDQCGVAADVTWLSESVTTVTLPVGKSVVVPVTFDASVPEVTQPGVETAALTFASDTPYSVPAVPVSLTVQPPATWGKLLGTVKGLDATGTAVPIAGATVQLDSWATSYSLTTAADGSYQLWLDYRNNPITVIVAKDGYQPQTATLTVVKGKPVVTNFTLKKK